ncbi:MAG: MotB family protein, partial [Pseudomonadota bacterium]
MSNDQTESEQGDIIIVKRGHGDHDEHHGGVWKIAFADFMTAMMAFFLVMWLINASNEQTKQALASYFNPIKLMDTTSNPKGVRNPKYGVEAKVSTADDKNSTKVSETEKTAPTAQEEARAYDEQSLFVDPFSLLSEIETGIDITKESDQTNADNGKKRGVSLQGGASFQDPFDPTEWNIREGKAEESGAAEVGQGESPDQGSSNLREDIVATSEESEVQEASEAAGEDAATEKAGQSGDEKEGESEGQLAGAEEQPEISADIEKLTESLNEDIKDLKEKIDVSELDVEVERSEFGAVVVLSDKNQSGMFSVGSARPTKELVLVMSRIGEAVSRHEGKIEIRGHTDGRKYQSGDYDNWRLSTARAHMAYYMLVRGGMKEQQVEEIVGQADVNLKDPENPF